MKPRPSATSSATYLREDLHRFVNELNVRYNIGIPIPEPNLNPAERREHEALADRIYRRLETHFFRGGLEALTSILRDFDARAKGLWRQCVPKPQGDVDTLPRLVRPPLAANPQERAWFQNLFNDILDKAQPSMAAPRRFGRTQSGPAALEGSASSIRSTRDAARVPQPKRPADAELKDEIKRPKADPDPIRDLTAMASCRRQPAYAIASASGSAIASASAGALTKPALAAMALSRPGSGQSFKSVASASTATTFNPSPVFSISNGPAPTGTQETIDTSSREQRLSAISSRIRSQQSYIDAPSSTVEDAVLTTSHHQHEASFRQPQAQEAESPVSPVQSTDSSYAPSSSMVEALRSASHLDVQSNEPIYLSSAGQVSRNNVETSFLDFSPLEDGDENPAVKTQDRLRGVWPSLPSWLRSAPFPIAWEATRIAQSCGVNLASIQDMAYKDCWKDQKELRKSFARHAAFQANMKAFPGPSDAAAWAASLEQSTILPFRQQVVYSTSLDFDNKHSPLRLTIQPLKLEQSYRLGRRFGADRFLELLVPSPDSSSLPTFVKNQSSTSFFHELVQHLQAGHEFCGRAWKAFYTKSGGSRKPVKYLQFGPDPKPVFKERIYFFAEQGCGIPVPVSMPEMLDWALDLRRKSNKSQPILKLFQRIALGK